MALHAVLAPFGAYHKRVDLQGRRRRCHSRGSRAKREFIRHKVNTVNVSNVSERQRKEGEGAGESAGVRDSTVGAEGGESAAVVELTIVTEG